MVACVLACLNTAYILSCWLRSLQIHDGYCHTDHKILVILLKQGYMSRYVISDYHFGHANIIKYCDRPFSSPSEMDTLMLNQHFEVVSPDGVLIHLGDRDGHAGRTGDS